MKGEWRPWYNANRKNYTHDGYRYNVQEMEWMAKVQCKEGREDEPALRKG